MERNKSTDSDIFTTGEIAIAKPSHEKLHDQKIESHALFMSCT